MSLQKMRFLFKRLLIPGCLVLIHMTGLAQLNREAAAALIKRVAPQQAAAFRVETLPASAGKDVFEIETRGGEIVLRGNTGVAVASAFYYYLTEYCHCQVTWNGTHLRLPDPLPVVDTLVRKTTPYTYRYYLNYCTFNYSMSWWDWKRWEKEIDWMALHGINMPLAITGEAYTWNEVYRQMGFSDKDLSGFFCGPSYFSWFWMGNLDGWGGPLPRHWMQTHMELEKKILQRERALGMKPVLPAFTGHVPAAFQKRYPHARLKKTNWNNGFGDTYILDPADPLFAAIGRRFLRAQTALFGTDHLYSSDTFNENEPPSDDTSYLASLSAGVYEAMKQADPDAVWVMQGWLFYSDRKFWKAPQIKALLDAVPDDRMILLDLAAEIEPVWKRTRAFYGKPWIWNMLHNFGGNISMFGRMDRVAAAPARALADTASGKMAGIGLTMEGIEQNPLLYELMMQHVWQRDTIAPGDWLKTYVRNRYGVADPHAINAWQVIRATAYNGKDIRDGAESILTGRPTFDSTTVWTRTRLNYPPSALLPAWDDFIKAIPACAKSDGFQYDLVDITRQVLANYALPLQAKWVKAYREKDIVNFDRYSAQFLALISDMDRLLATRKDFLLGPWISAARSWGLTPSEKALYERNARDLITLWGDANSPLHEYSCRQWSGLLNDFYKPRWRQFFSRVHKALQEGKEVDMKAFDAGIKQWEWQWVNSRKDYPVSPTGDLVKTVKALYQKYRESVPDQKVYNITDYGARPGLDTNNAPAIQAAIDAAAAAGGGQVLIPNGNFATGVIYLKSWVDLHLADHAILFGSIHRADYDPRIALALIVAKDQHHISITGKGVIDGQAPELIEDIFRMLQAGTLQDPTWKTKRPIEASRPMIITLSGCDQVRVSGVTIKNAACWVQTYRKCSHLRIDSIRVESTAYWNNDGIDIVDCKHTRITHCFVNAADDGICLKSEDPNDRCEDIFISDCTVRSSASAFKLGTASAGGFRNITVRNLTVYDTYRSAVALECVDGGLLENVDIRHVRARNTGNALFIRLGHRDLNGPVSEVRQVYVGDVSVEVPAGKPDLGYPVEGPPVKTPHNVFPSSVTGLPGHPVQDVTLEDIHIVYEGGASKEIARVDTDTLSRVTENAAGYPEFSMFGELPAWGLYVRHVEGIRLKNITLESKTADFRSVCTFDDVQKLGIDRLNVSSGNSPSSLILHEVPDPDIKGLPDKLPIRRF